MLFTGIRQHFIFSIFPNTLENDDIFLQKELPRALISVRYHLNRSEYVLKVYDEQDEYSEELKEKVKDMINDEVSLAAINPTFLHIISRKCLAVKIMRILQKHPELFQPVLNLTHKGKTPLVNACENKNGVVAKCLVQCGADVTIKDEKGKTAIYYAAKNNLPGVVEEILATCKFLIYNRTGCSQKVWFVTTWKRMELLSRNNFHETKRKPTYILIYHTCINFTEKFKKKRRSHASQS